MLSEYKCIKRICILNFTQFSQNRLLSMKYCSIKDCNSTPSCENVILHIIKDRNHDLNSLLSKRRLSCAFVIKHSFQGTIVNRSSISIYGKVKIMSTIRSNLKNLNRRTNMAGSTLNCIKFF